MREPITFKLKACWVLSLILMFLIINGNVYDFSIYIGNALGVSGRGILLVIGTVCFLFATVVAIVTFRLMLSKRR